MQPRLPQLQHVIAVGGVVPTGALPFAAQTRRGNVSMSTPKRRSTSCLLYTSGTVSAPKGVPTPYREVSRQCAR